MYVTGTDEKAIIDIHTELIMYVTGTDEKAIIDILAYSTYYVCYRY